MFDPLGLLCPIVLPAKIFLQELWSKKLEWDDPLEEKDTEKWSVIEKDLKTIDCCKFPRFVVTEQSKQVENRLLCFCDASEHAYACVIYLHQSFSNGLHTNIVFAKTRLAPVKKISIPRLELLAVVIGMRCLNFVKRQLKLVFKQMHVWTDSQCVIQWIATSKQLPVFVRNRIQEIS